MPVTPRYRLLQAADVPAAQRLRELAHWNQTDQDWLNLLAVEPHGCFAAEIAGQVIGTVTTTRFLPDSGPGSFGWIGMLLVDPEFRGQGIGSTLLQRAIDHLRGSGVETVKLDATPMGRVVYLKHGFQDEYGLERWAGRPIADWGLPIGDCGSSIRTAKDAAQPIRNPQSEIRHEDLPAVLAYDTAAFGADRRSIVQAWFQSWPERTIAVWEGSRLAGYALARRGARYQQAGPIVCDTPGAGTAGPDAGQALLARVFQLAAGQEVIIDILSENAWVRELVQRAGLVQQRTLTRMYQGPNATPGRPQSIVALAGPEVG